MSDVSDPPPATSIAAILQSLQALEIVLKQLPYQQSAPHLSHYRHIPTSVTEAHTLLTQGCSLVHATSTKFTLLSKIDKHSPTTLAVCADLSRGCQHVATAVLVLHDDGIGCTASARTHARQAARGVVGAVRQLVHAVGQWSSSSYNNNVEQASATSADTTISLAPRTGVVWQACNVVLEKRLPLGNRNALRRDLLTYKMDCNESIKEFQEMMDNGPAVISESSAPGVKNEAEADTTSWDDFLNGEGDLYTPEEMPVATSCVAILKCSRGSINAVLQVMDAVCPSGGVATMETAERLSYISKLHFLASKAGTGVTELGSVLYPPLSIEKVRYEAENQVAAVRLVLEVVLNESSPVLNGSTLPFEAIEVATKIHAAVTLRQQEIMDALDIMQKQENTPSTSMSQSANTVPDDILNAVRSSCATVASVATKVQIVDAAVGEFATQIHDNLPRYRELLAAKGDAKPFHDPETVWSHEMQWKPANLEEELSAHILLSLLNMGHGYKAQLQEAQLGQYKHGAYGSAYVTILKGVGRMLQSGSLDAKRMTKWTMEDTIECFCLQSIPAFAQQVTDIIVKAGESVDTHNSISLGDLILRAMSETGSSQLNSSSLVKLLVQCLPHAFNDRSRHASSGTDVHFYKKAQLCARDLVDRIRGSEQVDLIKESSIDTKRFTVMCDNVLPAVLRAKGVLLLTDDESANAIQLGKQIGSGCELEVELRALSVHACERIVLEINAMPSCAAAKSECFTASELDSIIWGVLGKEEEFRDAPRHFTPTSIFY